MHQPSTGSPVLTPGKARSYSPLADGVHRRLRAAATQAAPAVPAAATAIGRSPQAALLKDVDSRAKAAFRDGSYRQAEEGYTQVPAHPAKHFCVQCFAVCMHVPDHIEQRKA